MNSADVMQVEDLYQIPTYRKMPIAADRGDGCWIVDADGRRYLDLYGGHCVALLGHGHAGLSKALKDQVDRLLFYSNAVYSTVRARAAQRLGQMAPSGLRRAFFCNSGSEANEAAIKLARKHTGKSTIVAMEDGFHGRTLGSLAVTSSEKYRAPFQYALGPAAFVPFGDIEAVEAVLRGRGRGRGVAPGVSPRGVPGSALNDIAAVIIEPIQSMAGVYEAPAAYFKALREACDATGTCLIFDEIQTGVGRTGTFSISESLGVTPDLITLAKSLGGGVPAGAVLVSDAIADTVEYGDQGTTFGGGMLAMAAVEATLTALKDERLMEAAVQLEACVRERIGPMVHAIRGKGCLLGLDLGREAKPVITKLRDEGIIVGGANDPHVIRLMPPLVTPLDAIETFAVALERILETA